MGKVRLMVSVVVLFNISAKRLKCYSALSYMVYSSTLKMGAVSSSTAWVTSIRMHGDHIPESNILHGTESFFRRQQPLKNYFRTLNAANTFITS